MDKYCAHCGQRATTRRFGLHTLWDGQFVEEVFQLNRGLGRTLLELLYRPGGLARDYLAGHRKRYFNFITLLLLLVAVDALLRSYSPIAVDVMLEARFAITIPLDGHVHTNEVKKLLGESYRIVVLFTLPIAAFLQWLILWRLPYNYWEHVVAVTLLAAAQTLLSIIGGLIPLLPVAEDIMITNYYVTAWIVYTWVVLFYWQFTKGVYRTWFGRLWRVVVSWIFYISLTAGILGGVVAYNRINEVRNRADEEVPVVEGADAGAEGVRE